MSLSDDVTDFERVSIEDTKFLDDVYSICGEDGEDEGGVSEDQLDTVLQAIEAAGYVIGKTS